MIPDLFFLTDPLFYASAVPAVMVMGLSKGGFGGAFGFAAVPLMALSIPTVQAAGVMMPVLIIMDAVAVFSYRRDFDMAIIKALLPAALVGTGLGWLTAAVVPENAVRLLVGVIAAAFLLRVIIAKETGIKSLRIEKSKGKTGLSSASLLWGTLTGYTSFVAHAGGPPYQAYVVPLRQQPVLYAGTAAIFFAILNAIKLGPYALMGQLNGENVLTALILAPIAVFSTYLGVRLTRLLDERLFYRVLYISITLVAAKLIFDGLTGLLEG